MNLTDFVVTEAIVHDLQVSTKEEAIRAMVTSLITSGKINPNEEESIVTKLLEREKLGSTGIGNGVAVPHTKHPSVDDLVATVAIAKDGVEFDSLDGGPVFILFLLISPPDRSGDHLRGLENISRHLRNQKFCSFLRQASGKQDVIDLLCEADNNELDD